MQENINNAKDGDIIELPEGTFHISHTLVINRAENITILGKGKDKTILDFQSKSDSLDGWKIVSDGSVLQDFAIRNASGNGIVAEKVRGITIHSLKIGGHPANNNNGSSGILLSECAQSLLEECEVSGFVNSGIELISCEEIINRKNKVEENSAGIETRNCTSVDIYDNRITKNAIGILISHLASSNKKNTGRYRVFNNIIEDNNLEDKAASGTLLSGLPGGTGIFLLAVNYADIHGNTIAGQKTAGIIILSGPALQASPQGEDNAYCSGIGVHDNKLIADSVRGGPSGAIGKLLTNAFGNKIPDIIYDGYVNPSYLNTDGTVKDERKVCIHNNGNASFGDMDLPGNGAHRSNDIKKYDCSLPELMEVKLN